MIPERTDETNSDELAEEHDEKEAQVLQREPLETELMDHDESEVGEEFDGVEDAD